MITVFDTEDLMAPEVIADPYGYFGELRERDPVHWNPKWGWWIITRHADVVRLTREHEVFSSEFPPLPEPSEIFPPIAAEDWEDAEFMRAKFRTLARLDRPEHLAMRQVVHRWFTPRAVEKWRERLRGCAHELIEERLPAGEMEVKTEFAVWPPLITISLMLDIPLEEAAHLHSLTETFLELEEADPHRVGRSAQSFRRLGEYFEPLIEERRDDEREGDLISMMASGERRGTFSRDDCIATVVLLFLAGHDTTMSLITNGLHNLLRDRSQWELLRSDPEGLGGSTTEECLRYEPSIKGSMRRCLRDIEVSGTVIPAGDMVFWVPSAANRDPRVFDDPERFDITRSPNPHLGFGGGIHHCLGASLARVESQEVFRALAEMLPAETHLRDEEVEYESNLTMRTPRALRVAWR